MRGFARIAVSAVAFAGVAGDDVVSLLQTRADTLLTAESVLAPSTGVTSVVTDTRGRKFGVHVAQPSPPSIPTDAPATVNLKQETMALSATTNALESMDANGNWWPVTLLAKNDDGTYQVQLENSNIWQNVLAPNIRGLSNEATTNTSDNTVDADSSLLATADFALGADGANACPVGFKTIGDDDVCKNAMVVLGLGPWRGESTDAWADRPGGCFKALEGDGYMNHHIGSGKVFHSLICEKEPEVGQQGSVESRDGAGKWWSATVLSKDADGTYSALLNDGTRWQGVLPFNLRRKMISPSMNVITEDAAAFALDASQKAHSALALDASQSLPEDVNADSSLASRFLAGADGDNACPLGYKSIGDERTCQEATLALNGSMLSMLSVISHSAFPAGCFQRLSGEVYINNHTGDGAAGASPLCERDFPVAGSGFVVVEARDADGMWWPATVSAKNDDGTYNLALAGNVQVGGVSAFDVRRRETEAVGTTEELDTALESSSSDEVNKAATDSTVDLEASFLMGSDGSNSCPTAFTAILDEAKCQTAMAALGLGPWGRSDVWADHPGGCFRNPDGKVYFNSDEGAQKDERAPVCTKQIDAEVEKAAVLFAMDNETSKQIETSATPLSDSESDGETEMSASFDSEAVTTPTAETSSDSEADAEASLESEAVATPTAEASSDSDADAETSSESEAVATPIAEASSDSLKMTDEATGINASDKVETNVSDAKEPAVEYPTASSATFILAALGENECPLGYKGIGDRRTCEEAAGKLGIGAWAGKGSWGVAPAGCYKGAGGEVYLNNNSGWGQADCAPICERQFHINVTDSFEARDAEGRYWPVTLAVITEDGFYRVKEFDGTVGASVSAFNVRRMMKERTEVEDVTSETTTSEGEAQVSSDTTGSVTVNATEATETPRSHFGYFLLGASGTNGCPVGYKAIGDERTCRNALRALNAGHFQRRDSFSAVPAGCVIYPSGEAFVNSNTTGQAKEGLSPVCEREVETGVLGIEAYDAVAKWQPVRVTSIGEDGLYAVVSADGSDTITWPRLGQFQVRRAVEKKPSASWGRGSGPLSH